MYKEAKNVHGERSNGTCKFYDGLSDAVMEDNKELVDEDGVRWPNVALGTGDGWGGL